MDNSSTYVDKETSTRRSADVVSEIRYRERQKRSPLVYDPYAHLFVSPRGRQMLETALSRWPFFHQYIIAREKFFDDCLIRIFEDEHVSQLVILGAGNDMRAARLPVLKKKTVFEVDFADQTALKKRVVKQGLGMLPDNVMYVACDAAVPGLLEALGRAGFDPGQRAAWLLQGLLYYMKPEGVDSLFSELHKLPVQGSVLLIDMTTKDLMTSDPYPADLFGYLLSRGFSTRVRESLDDLTERYFREVYKGRWWVVEAVRQRPY